MPRSNSVTEKSVQLDGRMDLNHTEAACKSRSRGLQQNFTKSVDDTATLFEFTKQKEDDAGLFSSASFLPNKLAEQKETKQ